METVTCDIRDLPLSERSALERIVGHQLRETTQIIVNVVDLDVSPAAPTITPLESDVPTGGWGEVLAAPVTRADNIWVVADSESSHPIVDDTVRGAK